MLIKWRHSCPSSPKFCSHSSPGYSELRLAFRLPQYRECILDFVPSNLQQARVSNLSICLLRRLSSLLCLASPNLKYNQKGKIKFERKKVPPFLHFEKQAASLINKIMPSVQSDQHIINISASTIVLEGLHPPEHLHTVLHRTPLCHFLQSKPIFTHTEPQTMISNSQRNQSYFN
jgi:hypothetical protein